MSPEEKYKFIVDVISRYFDGQDITPPEWSKGYAKKVQETVTDIQNTYNLIPGEDTGTKALTVFVQTTIEE